MESYMELKKMLCRELEYIVNKGDLSPRDLDYVDKITHSIKSLVTIMAMDNNGKSDYSGSGLYGGYDNYNRGNGYDYGNNGNDTPYGMSGRNPFGRYVPGRGYSRDESKSQMLEHLDKMMNETTDKNEREMIQRITNELKTL